MQAGTESLSMEVLLSQARRCRGDAEAAVFLAEQLLLRSQYLLTPEERAQQAELDRMLGHPEDKATLVAMTDQAFRTNTAARVSDQLTHILDVQGVPRFFSPLDRTLLRGFQSFGSYLPGVAVPLVKEKMRRETANVILPAESDLLQPHLRARQREGLRMNVNFLGEALLGEREAQRRLEHYLSALADPTIECISVKISTIYSQISSLARENTIGIVADRLELLYRAAARHQFSRRDGTAVTKFVYLDMEEYRDLRLTADSLIAALARPGLEQVRAGIALQAYIPDSYGVLEQLMQWAEARVESGGTPLTVRVVKGANMELERVEASLAGWPAAPYQNKQDTDSHFKRMLRALLRPDNRGVLVGVASHNLFDIALALLWADVAQMVDRVQFEMLEGMANHQRRALVEATGAMLLYAPACQQEDFLNAIGYLIRRLDENTGADNFLRHTFQLSPESETWQRLIAGFRASLATVDSVSVAPRRTQDRREPATRPPQANHWRSYRNEPDTDWSLPHNATWIAGHLQSFQPRCGDAAPEIPLFLGEQPWEGDPQQQRQSFDPSRPGVVSCRFVEATGLQIKRAIEIADRDQDGWRKTTLPFRHDVLRKAAQSMRQRRADLIAAAVADGGKTVLEVDPEVSEAIDFTEFYPLTAAPLLTHPQAGSLGVVAVISPWNFPVAIPCGGVAAALSAGNTVILKPASDTVLPAYEICKCFWDAGVPRTALQMIPCSGTNAGRFLVDDPRVRCVVLTGGTATAKAILRQRPSVELFAETGGKNATIVTALSDRELAIKHILHSAFSNAGQKCSATSLLLLEQEVYEDRRFRETLIDAVESLPVGSAWDLGTKMGPLIRPPGPELARGLKELEAGESWVVMPHRVGDNPNLYRPGVKWGVQPGSFTHVTELFGPVLGVMPFRRLDEAVAVVNATGYGLTSGLESLDDREQELWKRSLRAGNLYINRSTTGAIVLRQPFGGMGASAYGAGLKAGGPNYVAGLMRHPQWNVDADVSAAAERMPPADQLLAGLVELAQQWTRQGRLETAALGAIGQAVDSIDRAARVEFDRRYDPVRLLGQSNIRRYLPVGFLRIRLQPKDPLAAVWIAAAAAARVRCRVVFSAAPQTCLDHQQLIKELILLWQGRIEWLEETDDQLAQAITTGEVDRIRILSETYDQATVLEACCEAFVPMIRRLVSSNGEVECLWYLREQAISHDYHRYGNIPVSLLADPEATISIASAPPVERRPVDRDPHEDLRG